MLRRTSAVQYDYATATETFTLSRSATDISNEGFKAKRVRKQKTDRLDAELLLPLLLEDRFPWVWVPSRENRDLHQLLWHRHRLVQMRTRIMNQLQAVAMNEGVRRKQA